jgi:hypothetical protein
VNAAGSEVASAAAPTARAVRWRALTAGSIASCRKPSVRVKSRMRTSASSGSVDAQEQVTARSARKARRTQARFRARDDLDALRCRPALEAFEAVFICPPSTWS